LGCEDFKDGELHAVAVVVEDARGGPAAARVPEVVGVVDEENGRRGLRRREYRGGAPLYLLGSGLGL